jgi:putative NIF3 family GTP cyclohydrolase 1 type 2
MKPTDLSRREFARLAAAGLLAGAGLASRPAPLTAQPPALTAREVVERIKKQLAADGVQWQGRRFDMPTVDTFKVGDPDTRVTGIATTFMATFGVLKRAAAAGRNFVISHEPTFWSHFDTTDALADDPVFKAKTAFVKEHGLVVWRFHDHQHQLKPDPIFAGLYRTLRWDRYQVNGQPMRFEMPATTLGALAAEVKERLRCQSVRVVGDPKLKVTRVALGGHTLASLIPPAKAADVVVVGEAREWDTPEYFRDLAAAGQERGLIVLPHELEEWGMGEETVRWLKGFLPGVPVEWVPAGEPFWRPV